MAYERHLKVSKYTDDKVLTSLGFLAGEGYTQVHATNRNVHFVLHAAESEGEVFDSLNSKFLSQIPLVNSLDTQRLWQDRRGGQRPSRSLFISTMFEYSLLIQYRPNQNPRAIFRL